MLNSRETAALVWLGIALFGLLVFIAASREAREHAGGLVAAVLKTRILALIAGTALYLAAVVWLAATVGVWTIDLLAPTIIWCTPAAVRIGFLALDASKEQGFFGSHLREAVGIVLVLELLVNLETLPLWWELLQLPTLVVLSVFNAFAGSDPQYAPLQSCLTWILAIIGGGLLIFSVGLFAVNLNSQDWPLVIRSLSLPVWLPLAALPAVFAWSLVMLYGKLWSFLRLFGGHVLPWWRRLGIVAAFGMRRRRLLGLSYKSKHELAATSSLVDSWKVSRRIIAEMGTS